MGAMADAIEQTLREPETVIESFSDPAAHLYYRLYFGTRMGDKYLCVVVKIAATDAFVLTAYLTDKMKRGAVIWTREK